MNNLATRHNQGKLEWSLVDFKALEPMVEVLMFGSKHYSPNNWKKGLETTKICESLLRHIFAYLGGEDFDKESGVHHIGHAQCNLLFLMHMIQNRPELDTRYNQPIEDKCQCGKPAMYVRDNTCFCSDCHALYLEAEIIRLKRGNLAIGKTKEYQLLRDYAIYKKGALFSNMGGKCQGIGDIQTDKVINFTDKKWFKEV